MALAARGARETEHGAETIDDPALANALRVRARGIHFRSVLLALAGTAVAWWLPP